MHEIGVVIAPSALVNRILNVHGTGFGLTGESLISCPGEAAEGGVETER